MSDISTLSQEVNTKEVLKEDFTGDIYRRWLTQDTDQNICSTKTFKNMPVFSNGHPKLAFQNTDIVKGENNSDENVLGWNFYDGSGTSWQSRLGYVEYQQCVLPDDTSTDYIVNKITFNCESQTGGDNGELTVCTTKEGKAYATAPTPDADDVSNKVATTEWVAAYVKKLMESNS